MNRLIGILILCVACALAGCVSAAAKKAKAEKLRQDESIKRLGYESSTLALMAGDAKAIKSETDRINQLLGEKQPNPPQIRDHVQAIADSAGRITEWAASGDKQIVAQKKEYWTLKNELKDCTDAQDAELLRYTMWGIILGGLAVVGSTAAAIFARSYPGVTWLAPVGNLAIIGWMLGGLSLGLRLFILWTGPYRWAAGVTIVACICFAVVWATLKGLWHARLKRGFVEVVATAEAVKARPEVSNEAVAEEAAKIQSPATTQLVQAVRAKELVDSAAAVAADKLAAAQ